MYTYILTYQVFEAYIDDEVDVDPDYSWDEYLTPEEKVIMLQVYYWWSIYPAMSVCSVDLDNTCWNVKCTHEAADCQSYCCISMM